jgi:hypothetical protein
MFPSSKTAEENFAAWQTFWNKDRIAELKHNLNLAARENGFAPDAFEPFWKIINQEAPGSFDIPEKYFELLGIAKSPTGYTQLSLLTPGKIIMRKTFLSAYRKAVLPEYSTLICSTKDSVIF